MKKIFTLIAVALATVAVNAETLINFESATTGIQVNGTTTIDAVKIKTNTLSISGIKFANGYTTENVSNGNNAELSVEGGFKAGDVISIAGAFNNADDTKKSAIDIFTLDGTTPTVLFTTQQFVNGRLVDNDPVVETYTLTADADKLYIGRNGNTGTFVTTLKVVRGAAGIETMKTLKVVKNGAIYNVAGQKVNASYKGLVIKDGKKMINK